MSHIASCAIFRAAFLLALLALAPTAHAQVTRLGDSVVVSDVGGVRRLPAVAYDPAHERWLVVWSLFPVGGRFLARDGTPLGAPFTVPMRNPGGSIAPRVVYAPALDAFLVTWLEEEGAVTRVSARLVRGDATGTPTFLGDDVTVSETSRPKHTESSPSASWSERSRTFLVTWADDDGDLDVRARRLDEHAAPIGDELLISSGPNFDGFPVVGIGAVTDAWLVAWTYEPGAGGGGIAGRTVGAADGALGSETVMHGTVHENYADIAYDSRRDRFMVATWHIDGGHDVTGQIVDSRGTPIGPTIPVAVTAEFEGGDGIGLAYNRAADTYVAVFQSTTFEVWASPISGEGVPGPRFEATMGARMGCYAPRIAADEGASRWLLVTSVDFDRIAAQVLEAPAIAMPDGGASMLDAGAPTLDGGSLLDGAPSGDAGHGRGGVTAGCSCRVGTREPTHAAVALTLVVLFALGLRRGSRDRSASRRPSGSPRRPAPPRGSRRR